MKRNHQETLFKLQYLQAALRRPWKTKSDSLRICVAIQGTDAKKACQCWYSLKINVANNINILACF